MLLNTSSRRFSLPKPALLGCLLLLVVVGTFLPSLRNDFVNYDDPLYVTSNPSVQNGLTWDGVRWAFSTGHASNWHPLTWLSHMADCQIFGMKSWGHHLTNVLLHALDTLLLFLALRHMTGATWPCLFVAALFGLHPLHVQSVAWVAERKDLLSTVFWMLALWTYAHYARRSRLVETAPQTQPQSLSRSIPLVIWYLLTVLFFTLGLLSKPMVVTLPFVLLLLDYWPLNRFPGTDHRTSPASNPRSPGFIAAAFNLWPLVIEKIPLFILAAASSAATLAVQKNGGALRELATLPLMFRVENALVAYCRYLGKFFYPVHLAAFYPLPNFWPLSQVLLAACLLTGISILVVAMRRRHPYLFVGWLWYLGTLLPVIGLVQVGWQSIADRYTYIPLTGIFLVLTWSARSLTHAWQSHRILLGSAAAVVLLCCAGVTRWQIGFWADSETLFRRALAVTDDNALARLNLGVALGEKKHPEALTELKAALKLVPDNADLQFTVGNAMVAIGYPREAIIPLQKSLALDPGQARCHLALGKALERTGRLEEAILHYRVAARLKPEFLDAHNDLGLALCRKGQFEEAIDQFNRALRLEPKSADTYNFLGFALDEAGQPDEAAKQFHHAIGIKPDFAEAYSRLGVVFLGQGKFDEAIRQFQKALGVEPDYADAHVNFGVALYKKGDLDGAAKQFEQALVLEPSHERARKNLDALIDKKRSPPSR